MHLDRQYIITNLLELRLWFKTKSLYLSISELYLKPGFSRSDSWLWF